VVQNSFCFLGSRPQPPTSRAEFAANILLLWFLLKNSHYNIHPKTLMWITCLDPVSANSEKGRDSEWAVGWGKDCRPDSGRAEQPENWIWYKLSWKRRKLGGVCQALSCLSLFLAGAVATVCGDYGEGLRLRPHGQKHMQTLALDQTLFQGRRCRFDQPEV